MLVDWPDPTPLVRQTPPFVVGQCSSPVWNRLSLVMPCTLRLNRCRHLCLLLFLLFLRFNEPASGTFRFKAARTARTARPPGLKERRNPGI